MKRIFSMILCMAFLAIASVNVQAQGQNGEKQRLSREELAVKQAKHLAVDLNLDDAVTKRFIETYVRCQKEIWEARGQVKNNQRTQAKTEEEIRQQILNGFARNRKLQDIREKYYEEFSQFLTQKQISEVYDQEMIMRMHLTMKKKKSKRANR